MKPKKYCRWCGEYVELIKAHIIPEKFFKSMQGEEGPIREYSRARGAFPKKRPIGIYDTDILCLKCEQKFQLVDDYGQKILLQREMELERVTKDKSLACYKLENVDGNLLKQFFISILWRASVSKVQFFEQVRLGKFEGRAKEIVCSGVFSTKNEFAYCLTRYDTTKYGEVVSNPMCMRVEGINFVMFTLPNYVVHVKVDSRQAPEYITNLQLVDDGVLLLGARKFEFSGEYWDCRDALLKKRIS